MCSAIHMFCFQYPWHQKFSQCINLLDDTIQQCAWSRTLRKSSIYRNTVHQVIRNNCSLTRTYLPNRCNYQAQDLGDVELPPAWTTVHAPCLRAGSVLSDHNVSQCCPKCIVLHKHVLMDVCSQMPPFEAVMTYCSSKSSISLPAQHVVMSTGHTAQRQYVQ